jgi:hypothetical protein
MLGEAFLMNRRLTTWVAAVVVLLASVACRANEVFPVVHNETLTVRVLDGEDGKPQARVHVVLVGGYDRRDLGLRLWREEAVTDAEGKLRLSSALRNLPLLRAKVLKRHPCSPGSNDAAISVERVRRDGLSSVNRCGFATAADAPGVLTVFVTGSDDPDEEREAHITAPGPLKQP